MPFGLPIRLHCHSDQVIKGGKTQAGKQRYKCLNMNCPRYSFQLDLTYKGLSPEVKEHIIDMALNGSGMRDTARVLKISSATVIHGMPQPPLLVFLAHVGPELVDFRFLSRSNHHRYLVRSQQGQ